MRAVLEVAASGVVRHAADEEVAVERRVAGAGQLADRGGPLGRGGARGEEDGAVRAEDEKGLLRVKRWGERDEEGRVVGVEETDDVDVVDVERRREEGGRGTGGEKCVELTQLVELEMGNVFNGCILDPCSKDIEHDVLIRKGINVALPNDRERRGYLVLPQEVTGDD